MSETKALVLDANILIRAVLGTRVAGILETFRNSVRFCAPDVSFHDASHFIPRIIAARGGDPELGLALLRQIGAMVTSVELAQYQEFELPAKTRMIARDLDDWPILAVALLVDAPIWTEDQDFFGSGVATWTTDRIELYLRGSR